MIMYKKIYRNMCFLSLLTLVLSAVVSLTVFYTSFKNRVQAETEYQTHLVAEFLNKNKNFDEFNIKSESKISRLFYSDKNGTVIYETGTELPSRADNLKEDIKKSVLSGGNKFCKNVFPSGMVLCGYTLKLENGDFITTVSSSTPGKYTGVAIIGILGVVGLLIFILSAMIARTLTENIVKPIGNQTEETDSTYKEIRPLLQRIRRQEEEIMRQVEKTKTQKMRLQAVADNINEGVVILDREANVISLNNCALEIFKPEEGTGIKYKSYQFLCRNAQLEKAVSKAENGEKCDVSVEIFSKTYQIFCSPIFEDGAVSGVVLLLFDVSERAKSEQIRREFSANVSHELKTPLTTIHGYAQLVSSGIARPEDVGGFLNKIETESLRLVALIDDIIKLSKLDENAHVGEKTTFDLESVVCGVAEILKEKADKKDVKIAVKCDETQIFANRSQVTELVYNLCDNAIKYNKQGGDVTMTVKDSVLTVEDTGIGIEKQYLDRIFERFFRADISHSNKISGTGLGLSIVKHIAQTNGAKIDVKSTPGKGSIFTVEFCAI